MRISIAVRYSYHRIDVYKRQAHQRGTAGSFRLDVKGSDKSFNFCYRGEGERLFAVSYTHLDVYKRQVLAKLHELVQAAAELPGKVRHKEQERGL